MRRQKRSVDIFRGKLVITNYIFDEVITLVSARLGHDIAVNTGTALQDSPHIETVWIRKNDETHEWTVVTERKEKGYSFTDYFY